MGKRGLVLGGGGAKGAYQMGAWQAFRELGLEFDVIVGSSIGAINGALMTQGDYELAVHAWENIEQYNFFGEDRREGVERICSTLDLVKYALSDVRHDGTHDASALEQVLRDNIDEQKVRRGKNDFGLVTLEIPQLRGHMLMRSNIPQGKLIEYLLASSACFPVFPPVEIDGVHYLDGGYYDNLPVSMAAAQGADEIISVDLEAVGIVREPKDDRGLTITKIRSRWDLGALFAFEKSLYEKNQTLGYQDTMKSLGYLDGMAYTFTEKEARKNHDFCRSGLERAERRMEQLLARPLAKTIQKVDRASEIAFFASRSWKSDGPLLLCRMAEIAGELFELSPLKVYRFEEFNALLLREYRRFSAGIRPARVGEAAEIFEAFSSAADARRIAAQIMPLLRRDMTEHAALTQLLPREYVAAVYLELLTSLQQEG